jgi:hypothetical protein
VPLRFLNGGGTSKGWSSEREGDVSGYWVSERESYASGYWGSERGNYASGYWAWTEEIVYILVLVEIRRIEVSIFLFLMG